MRVSHVREYGLSGNQFVEMKTVGVPDGEMRFVPEMGCETTLFTQQAENCLQWQVPFEFRGDFRPEELANYDAGKTYRTDIYGRLLCYAKTQTGKRCGRRAINRYPRCEIHGGKLHPLDKLDKGGLENEGELSRWRQFQKGLITVDDLDDEELSQCGFRTHNGGIFKPKNIPRSVAQEFQKAIFERANEELRSGAVAAAKSLVRLATDSAVEDSVQLKAAQDLLDRAIGKAANVVQISADKPWQEVFDGLATISREESRKARAEAIDAEVVELSPFERSAKDRMYQRNPAILNPKLNYEAPEYDPSVLRDPPEDLF